MLTALIAKPPPRTRTLEKPNPLDRPRPSRKRPQTAVDLSSIEQPVRTFEPPEAIDDYDEERYITKLILMMVVVLVLPPILMLLYIIFTPDAFQYDITPKQDFSSWHPGKSL